MLLAVPIGDPSKVAWCLSTTLSPGTARSMAFLVALSSQINSDFPQFGWRPSFPCHWFHGVEVLEDLLQAIPPSMQSSK